jgi:hypothetical protein
MAQLTDTLAQKKKAGTLRQSTKNILTDAANKI